MSKKPKLKLELTLKNIITCAVYAIIGILFIVLKGGSLGVIMTIIGGLLVVLGIMDIFKEGLLKGLIEAAIGIGIIVCGWLIADIVLLILGIALIVKGGMDFWENRKGGAQALLSPCATIIIGILLLFAKGTFINICCIIVGIIFVLNAVLALCGTSLKK